VHASAATDLCASTASATAAVDLKRRQLLHHRLHSQRCCTTRVATPTPLGRRPSTSGRPHTVRRHPPMCLRRLGRDIKYQTLTDPQRAETHPALGGVHPWRPNGVSMVPGNDGSRHGGSRLDAAKRTATGILLTVHTTVYEAFPFPLVRAPIFTPRPLSLIPLRCCILFHSVFTQSHSLDPQWHSTPFFSLFSLASV